jgi:hypothetical protein
MPATPSLGKTTATAETPPPPPSPVPDSPPVPFDGPDSYLIHFVEDGHTAFGQVWYRGQELLVKKDSDQFKQTLTDPEDASTTWLALDEYGQIRRWGRRVFRPGAWPGQSNYEGAQFESLAKAAPPTAEELREAAMAEHIRARAAKTS